MSSMFSRKRLSQSLRTLGAEDSGSIYDALAAAYDAPSRHYHDRRHIEDCLAQFRGCRDLSEQPPEVELAIWFHDAVYDTRRSDNEERSADWARSFLGSEGVEEAAIQRIGALIMATKGHENPVGIDQRLIADIDLSILGRDPESFERYDRAIRAEYAWVPEERFRLARAAVLDGFLGREAIYATPVFRERYERQARRNIARKLDQLR